MVIVQTPQRLQPYEPRYLLLTSAYLAVDQQTECILRIENRIAAQNHGVCIDGTKQINIHCPALLTFIVFLLMAYGYLTIRTNNHSIVHEYITRFG